MKRGRPSSASLAVLENSVDTIPRVRAPHELNDEETEVWVSIVNAMPADWFSAATTPLLVQYCRHVVHARRLSETIERVVHDKKLPFKNYAALLVQQRNETTAIIHLSTKMRLTQQSTINARGNRKQRGAFKPWDESEEA